MSAFFTAPASQRKRKREGNFGGATKRQATGTSTRKHGSKPRRRAEESSISGSGSDDSDDGDARKADAGSRAASEDDSDDEAQTAADRRRKLAERYLENMRADLEEEESRLAGGFNAEDVDRDLLAARLKEDVAEERGRIYRRLANDLDVPHAQRTVFRADTLPTSGVAICHPYVYTVSKDMTLIKWKLIPPTWSMEQAQAKKNGHTPPRRRKPKQMAFTKGNRRRSGEKDYKHHVDAILCVAASADGRFVVTGGLDRRLIVWDAKTLQPLRTFTQHRDAVTSLAFRGKTNQLFSGSKDRTIRIWSLNEMAYVETLFGHQDGVLDVAAVGGSQERCVSVGARDRSARLWKVVEESQLVFRGGASTRVEQGPDKDAEGDHERTLTRAVEGSLDRVAQLDTQLFVTGSDSGALSLFSLHKKKALHVLPFAHGLDPALSAEDSSAEADPLKRKSAAQPSPRGITALACVPFSDLFVSGSWDGHVRAWKVSEDQKRIESVGVLAQDPSQLGDPNANAADAQVATGVPGVVNDLAVMVRGDRGKDGICVVAAVGTEPRNGRWLSSKGKNCAVVFEIAPKPGITDGVVNGA